MSLEEQPVAEADILVLELQTDHQTLTAVFLDGLIIGKGLMEIIAYLCCVFYKMLIFNDVQYGKRSCTCEVVSSESGSEHAV